MGSSPVAEVTALACTVDPVKRDAEVKFLWRCIPDEISLVERFYSPQRQAAMIIRR